MTGAFEQGHNVMVGELPEVVIPRANGSERNRLKWAHNEVGIHREPIDGFGVSYRYGADDRRGSGRGDRPKHCT
jgi:hypothetical protein